MKWRERLAPLHKRVAGRSVCMSSRVEKLSASVKAHDLLRAQVGGCRDWAAGSEPLGVANAGPMAVSFY